MNTYIPADKLITEIEDLKSVYSNKKRVIHGIADGFRQDGMAAMCDIILTKITSLQQEQPKFKVGDTIHKKGENTVFPMVIERISDGDYVCDNAHSFINIEYQDDYELVQQEQPEVELEKEIEEYFKGWFVDEDLGLVKPDNWSCIVDDLKGIARHFYELGLNARKEK